MSDLEQLAADYVAARKLVEGGESNLKGWKGRLLTATLQLYEAITQSNQRSYQHVSLGGFAPIIVPHASIKSPSMSDEGEVVDEHAREELEAWAKEQVDATGRTLFEDLFGWAVKSVRLKSLVRERLAEGLDPPPGTAYFAEQSIRWTRPKKSAKEK